MKRRQWKILLSTRTTPRFYSDECLTHREKLHRYLCSRCLLHNRFGSAKRHAVGCTQAICFAKSSVWPPLSCGSAEINSGHRLLPRPEQHGAVPQRWRSSPARWCNPVCGKGRHRWIFNLNSGALSGLFRERSPCAVRRPYLTLRRIRYWLCRFQPAGDESRWRYHFQCAVSDGLQPASPSASATRRGAKRDISPIQRQIVRRPEARTLHYKVATPSTLSTHPSTVCRSKANQYDGLKSLEPLSYCEEALKLVGNALSVMGVPPFSRSCVCQTTDSSAASGCARKYSSA